MEIFDKIANNTFILATLSTLFADILKGLFKRLCKKIILNLNFKLFRKTSIVSDEKRLIKSTEINRQKSSFENTNFLVYAFEAPKWLVLKMGLDSNTPTELKAKRRHVVSMWTKQLGVFTIITLGPFIFGLLIYTTTRSIQEFIGVLYPNEFGIISLIIYWSIYGFIFQYNNFVVFLLLSIMILIHYICIIFIINLFSVIIYRIYDYFFNIEREKFFNIQKIILFIYFGISFIVGIAG